ncbi:MAG: hypothetical protein KJ914_05800 [Gammaproteobacteria bacterium]|nr:hypothetical protein [Gammaproteobacteria bacterium]
MPSKPLSRFLKLLSTNRKKQPLTLQHYDLRLYNLGSDNQRGALKAHEHSPGEPPQTLTLDGFSRSLCIDLSPYWAEILQNQLEHYQAHTATYETIVKFGEALQLINEYEIVFDLKYSPAPPAPSAASADAH